MRSIVSIQLPGNINCVSTEGGSIHFSTTTFLPKGYECEQPIHMSSGKARKRYVRTEFSIPANSPVNEIWDRSTVSYQKATKELRVDIAKYKLRKQIEHLAKLKSL